MRKSPGQNRGSFRGGGGGGAHASLVLAGGDVALDRGRAAAARVAREPARQEHLGGRVNVPVPERALLVDILVLGGRVDEARLNVVDDDPERVEGAGGHGSARGALLDNLLDVRGVGALGRAGHRMAGCGARRVSGFRGSGFGF